MEEAQLSQYYDSLLTTAPRGGHGGLGLEFRTNLPKDLKSQNIPVNNGLPDNALYRRFVKAGSSNYKKFGTNGLEISSNPFDVHKTEVTCNELSDKQEEDDEKKHKKHHHHHKDKKDKKDKHKKESLFLVSYLVLAMEPEFYGVSYEDNKYVYHKGYNKGDVAQAKFVEAINATGWNFLSIETFSQFSNEVQSYAAGYIEGAATYKQIYLNIKNRYGGPECPEHIQKILDSNRKWEEEMIAKSSSDKNYWEHRQLLDLQIQAMYDGYMAVAPQEYKNISLWQIQYINYDGDVGDWWGIQDESRKEEFPDHCSALITLSDTFDDIMMSQVTWSALETMYRMYKQYKMPLTFNNHGKITIIPGYLQVMSTYPARISSGDDFYYTSAKLGIQETTIGVFNDDLKKYITPQVEWIDLYKQYNSGTYNNQWMVIDYKNIKEGEPLPKDTFWLLEQIPGYTEQADLTEYLNKYKFFPSYNIPYFKNIYNITGYPAKNTSRAKIFARDAPSVHSLKDMRHMMMYNDYTRDEFSVCGGNPGYSASLAISCRGDLNDPNGTYPLKGMGWGNHVNTDGKIISKQLFEKQYASQIISGPTHQGLPPFQWSTSLFKDLPHEGLPDIFNFPWVEINWDTMTWEEL
ncbi:hypothetical protein WA158_008537 [Blastocystis sp. Blastoise]